MDKTFTAIFIDDDTSMCAAFAKEVANIPQLHLAGCFENVSAAAYFLKGNGVVDIIFCDIEMPDISGFDAMSLLEGYYEYFFFASGHTEYALEMLRADANGLLEKPFRKKNIMAKLMRLRGKPYNSRLPAHQKNTLGFYNDDKKRRDRVLISNITRIRVDGNYIYIYAPEKIGSEKMTMKQAEELLRPTGLFMRVNQSWLVAYRAITLFDEDHVFIGKEPIKVTGLGRAVFEEYKKGRQLN